MVNHRLVFMSRTEPFFLVEWSLNLPYRLHKDDLLCFDIVLDGMAERVNPDSSYWDEWGDYEWRGDFMQVDWVSIRHNGSINAYVDIEKQLRQD